MHLPATLSNLGECLPLTPAEAKADPAAVSGLPQLGSRLQGKTAETERGGKTAPVAGKAEQSVRHAKHLRRSRALQVPDRGGLADLAWTTAREPRGLHVSR